VFCACDIVQLFSVVFCVVRTVNKFDFRHVINETPNKCQPMERRSCSDGHVFDRICMFSPDRHRKC
jgi:hypothetical protein